MSQSAPPRPTRRTVAKAGLWTAPVIAVGAVAPSAAASPACPAFATPSTLALSYSAVSTSGTRPNRRWDSNSTLSNSVLPATGAGVNRPLFAISSPQTVKFVIDTYSLKLTYPFPVAYPTSGSGWTVVSSTTGAGTSKKYTYTFTPGTNLLGNNVTYSSRTTTSPTGSTSGLFIPNFTGATTHTQAVTSGWMVVGQSAESAVPVVVDVTLTYRIVQTPGCPTNTRAFSRVGPISPSPN